MSTEFPQLRRKAFTACKEALRPFRKHHKTLFVALFRYAADGALDLVVRFDTDPDVARTFGEVPGRADYDARIGQDKTLSFQVVFATTRHGDVLEFKKIALRVRTRIASILADPISYVVAGQRKERPITDAERRVSFTPAPKRAPRRATRAQIAMVLRHNPGWTHFPGWPRIT